MLAGRAGRTRRTHLEVTRPLLNEEIIALSQQVSALPTTSDPQQSKLSKDVLDTVEKARHRLDAAKGDADVEAVTTLLGSARYGLVCLDAVRAGKPIPEPTAPCFFDPRHGPSTDTVEWQPERGSVREVSVCAACKQRAVAGEEPQVRMVEQWSDQPTAVLDGRRGHVRVHRRLLVAGRRPALVVPRRRRPPDRRADAGAVALPAAPVRGSAGWSSDVGFRQ